MRGSSFQRLMDMLLRELIGECALVYLDDVIVYSTNLEEHLRHLHAVFAILLDAGLTCKLTKCFFVQQSVEY